MCDGDGYVIKRAFLFLFLKDLKVFVAKYR